MMKDEFPCKVTAFSTSKPLDRNDSGVLQLLTPEGEMKEEVSLPKEAHLKDLEKFVREFSLQESVSASLLSKNGARWNK